MKFVDEARIIVKGGSGGNGCISFRREKFVPRGGPNGGDGGDGGSVYIKSFGEMYTLLDCLYHPMYKAKRGGHGKGKNKHGRNGEDIFVKVPVGTVVKNKRGEVITELLKDKEEFLIARGGKGGKGNAHFATSINRAPRYAQKGKDGEKKEIFLELKLIADVGIIGFPNAGKSTLLNGISRAHSKVASYPFTTLAPNLGAININYKKYIWADLPGLIEGASKGIGLGIKFLRHAERTKLFVHVVDISSDGAFENFEKLNKELMNYKVDLRCKPQIVAANKIDIANASGKYRKFRDRIKHKFPVICISALTGKEVNKLIKETLKYL